MHSMRKEPRRRYTRKEKVKMKLLEYKTNKGVLDQGESDTNKSEDES